MHSDIKVRTFTGRSLKTHLLSIARLRLEIFREYPYLFEGDLEKETEYLRKHIQSNDAIGVLVFDGSTIVGASTAMPLENESELLQKPFLDSGLDPSAFFYFGKSFLLPPYRGRGIGHHFFDLRESHSKDLKRFQHICFCAVSRPESDSKKKPPDFLSLEGFWRKRGYMQHPELTYSMLWKDVDEPEESEKKMIFWTKDLP